MDRNFSSKSHAVGSINGRPDYSSAMKQLSTERRPADPIRTTIQSEPTSDYSIVSSASSSGQSLPVTNPSAPRKSPGLVPLNTKLAATNDDGSEVGSLATATSSFKMGARWSAFGPPKRPRKPKLNSSGASSVTTERTLSSLSSPYMAAYNAEDGEDLFAELEKALEDPTSSLFSLAQAVRKSGVLFSSSWLEGRVAETSFTAMDPSILVICLDKNLFHKAQLSVLKSMAKKMGLDSIVKDLVAESGNADKYPKISDSDSALITRRDDVLKCILFLSRVYGVKKYFKLPLVNDAGSWGLKFDGKIRKCLQIVEDSVTLWQAKQLGEFATREGRVKTLAPVAEDKSMATRRISSTEDPRSTTEQKARDRSEKKRRHEGAVVLNEPKKEPTSLVLNKKRRGSLEIPNPFNLLGPSTLLDSNLSLSEKLDYMEVYFKHGLDAIHQLRLQLGQELNVPKLELKENDSRTSSPVPPPKERQSSSQILEDAIRQVAGITKTNPGTSTPKAPKEKDAAGNENEVTDDEMLKKIFDVLKARVWRRVKFLKSNEELDEVCKFVAKQLDESTEEFSEKHKASVCKALSKIRSQVREPMKKAVFKFMDEHGGELPEVKDMQGLRQSYAAKEPGSGERFEFLWDYLVPAVSDAWAEQNRERWYLISDKLSLFGHDVEVVSRCDEAFALLAFENYREVFIAEWNRGEPGKAKFSKKGKAKKGTEFLAWSSQECDDRWNELKALVKADRKSDADNQAEKSMLKYLQEKEVETIHISSKAKAIYA